MASKHCKSAKLPCNHNFEISNWSWFDNVIVIILFVVVCHFFRCLCQSPPIITQIKCLNGLESQSLCPQSKVVVSDKVTKGPLARVGIDDIRASRAAKIVEISQMPSPANYVLFTTTGALNVL